MAQHSYMAINEARHSAGKTYLEKSSLLHAERQAAKIAKEQVTSSDKIEGDETEGAVREKPAGKMKMKATAKKPKGAKPAKKSDK